MYSIGLFSKIHRISPKTLRHYDALGLLRPAAISSQTGYRYYSSAQIPKLNRILSLKQLGLSLNDIKLVMDDPSCYESKLAALKADLQSQLASLTQQLQQIESYQGALGEQAMGEYAPLIKPLPQCIVASMRFRAASYESFFDYIPKMGREMSRLGARLASPGYCFNLFHDGEYKDSDIDVETCEAVEQACQDSAMVQFKTIESVPQALCVLHKGPYSTLRHAYAFAFDWLAQNGYQAEGLPRESYIDGIWNQASDEHWLTEVQIPIALIGG